MKAKSKLDAVIAAPEFHILKMENDEVRVLETNVEPGQVVPIHTHEWPMVTYFMRVADLVRRDEHGDVTYDTRTNSTVPQPGEAVWSPPLGPHTLENVGTTTLHVLTVEIKPRR